MPLELEIVNPLVYPGWDKLVLSTPNYSFFHSEAWARVLHESYGYKPLYFSLISDNRLLVLLPVMEVNSILTGKRGVSLPFTDYCDPIISGEINRQEVFDFIKNYAKEAGWRYIEIRGNGDIFHDKPNFSFYYRHTLNLSSKEDQILSQFKSSTQRNIKKAMRENVEINMSNSFDSLKDFYRLNCMTRKEHGLPPQPFFFFKKIYDHVISKKHGLVARAFLAGRAIAAAVYFHLGTKVIYKYGASDKVYQHLRPNNLVMWEAIRWYSGKGYKSFCLGRTEPGNSGLRQFKNGWGTEEKIIKYYRYSINQGGFIEDSLSQKEGFTAKVFRRMPALLSKTISNVLYKHVG